jgi:hypothetical protein
LYYINQNTNKREEEMPEYFKDADHPECRFLTVEPEEWCRDRHGHYCMKKQRNMEKNEDCEPGSKKEGPEAKSTAWNQGPTGPTVDVINQLNAALAAQKKQ